MLENNALGQPQAKSSPVQFFGCEKWFQNAVTNLERYSRTFIVDRKDRAGNSIPLRRTDANADSSLPWRRVNGIADQICQHLAQLTWKSVNAARLALLQIYPDVLSIQLNHIERKHGLHHVLQIKFNRDFRLAMKREDLFGDLGHAFQLFGGLAEK